MENKEKIYGVVFNGNIEGKRAFDAVGMVAEVGVDDQIVRNDFDAVFPWAGMRRCNTEIVNGERFPSVFEGSESFDSVNKDVFVYVPLFFYQRSSDGEECSISNFQYDGMDAPRKFKRADGTYRDFVFLPAYTAGIVDGKPVSRSGLDPFITSLNGWMDITAPLGDLCIESTMDDEIKNILLDVEFATRDPRSIMTGATNADDVFPSGACDNVRASSGSLKDNKSGQYPCKYRGIENPWGNQFRFRWDVLISNGVPHVLTDPRKYARGKITNDYTALSYKISGYDGWADKFGFDPAFPNVQLPVSVEDSYSESAYGVYFWQWSDNGPYILLVGGYVSLGRGAGARYCYVSYAPGSAYWHVGAALSPA